MTIKIIPQFPSNWATFKKTMPDWAIVLKRLEKYYCEMSKIKILLALFLLILPCYGNEARNLNISWFENFNDPILIKYITQALCANKEIKIAKNNILKYRQERNLKISKEFPYLSVGSNYLLLKVPRLAIPDNDIQTNSYVLPFVTMWEIDYLGKNYNKIQKSALDMKNSEAELKSANLIVITDVAGAYFNISNSNKKIELQNERISVYKNIFDKYKKMYENGVISLSELNLAEDELHFELNKLQNFYKEKALFMTELAFLVGESPYNIDKFEITSFDEINYTGVYPESFKGDVVFSRPDIILAENNLKKAKLDITIAKKEFFPSMSVFGILTFSTILQKFNWNTALATLSAGVTQTLFDGGSRIFTLKKRKIEYDTMLEEFLKTDLNALKEVNDTLYALKKDYAVYKNDQKRFEFSKINRKLRYSEYSEGAKSYLDYLKQDAKYLKADIALNDSKNKNFISLISLYKAVAGEL